MMNLKTILKDVKIKSGTRVGDIIISRVTDDSRKVAPGSLFIAAKGCSLDGSRFIESALKAGAKVIVAEEDFGRSDKALKILVGAKEINQDLIFIDVWKGTCHRLRVKPRSDCPACRGRYDFLDGQFGVKTTSLCGQNAVQVVSSKVNEDKLT